MSPRARALNEAYRYELAIFNATISPKQCQISDKGCHRSIGSCIRAFDWYQNQLGLYLGWLTLDWSWTAIRLCAVRYIVGLHVLRSPPLKFEWRYEDTGTGRLIRCTISGRHVVQGSLFLACEYSGVKLINVTLYLSFWAAPPDSHLGSAPGPTGAFCPQTPWLSSTPPTIKSKTPWSK